MTHLVVEPEPFSVAKGTLTVSAVAGWLVAQSTVPPKQALVCGVQPTFKKRRLELERVYNEACQAASLHSTSSRPAFKGCQSSSVHVQAQA